MMARRVSTGRIETENRLCRSYRRQTYSLEIAATEGALS